MIPVYLFVGFLEGGKTSFLCDTLNDEAFADGDTTLVLLCEQGELEMDAAYYADKNVHIVDITEESQLNRIYLNSLALRYQADRVFVEMNGLYRSEAFLNSLPRNWELAQKVTLCDASTLLLYNQNLRECVVDHMRGSELVVCNRMPKDADILPLHRLIRALNRRAEIAYEYADGSYQMDEIIDPLPYDLDAPIVQIADDDFAVFYADLQEEGGKYEGKTVRLTVQVLPFKQEVEHGIGVGRRVMTCCEADIAYQALPCKTLKANTLKAREWVELTAEISMQQHPLYEGRVAVLVSKNIQPCAKPEREVCEP